MRTLNLAFTLIWLFTAVSAQQRRTDRISQRQAAVQEDPVDYVDPFIGTIGGGNTFPGASLPFGMVKLGPDCGDLNTNSGYDPDSPIRGFSHVHVSGTGGGPKYGNILVYPFYGELLPDDYGSFRDNEVARPGYYCAGLAGNTILAELTCSHKTGLHRYTFKTGGKSGILIDAGSFLGRNSCCFEAQELVGSEIEVLSEREMAGYSRVRGGWNTGGPYTVYFYAIFDHPALSFGTWKSKKVHPNVRAEFDSGDPAGAWFEYDCKPGQVIGIKVGISFISAARARANCLIETGAMNFDQAMTAARNKWSQYLNRLLVQTSSKTLKTKFYTALYHAILMPADRTGENPLWMSNQPYYDDFYCIWDTYRTNHPLITLFAPERQTAMVNSLIDIYEHEGYMPDARSGNASGRTQGGTNCDMLVAEAILKDLPGVDFDRAYAAMIKNAEVPPGGDERMVGRGGLRDYIDLGYVSTDFERAGSRTLEYAANDWAIALAAKKLRKVDDYRKYAGRAGNWENLWKPVTHDGATGFIMPRKSTGEWDEEYHDKLWSWYEDISPAELGMIPYNQIPGKYLKKEPFTTLSGGSWMDFFYESHSWEYSFYVPQDMTRLIEKCGGEAAFVKRLDTFFAREYFIISNEPGFLTPCLYNYAGRPDRTAEVVTGLLKKHYTEKRDGIPGNDDSGAMSSWFVFQSMGFFPVAGQDIYLITSPKFPRTVIDLGGGRKMEILADNLSDKNIYVMAADLNGLPWNRSWFRHSDIGNGGTLRLYMGHKPTGWGKDEAPPGRMN